MTDQETTAVEEVDEWHQQFVQEKLRAMPWRRWFTVAALIAVGMIVAITVMATFVAGDPFNQTTIAHQSGFDDWWYILRHNLLVLAIHFCACLVGALVAVKPHELDDEWVNAPGKWTWARKTAAGMNRELPQRLQQLCLAYAAGVTMCSILLQTLTLGYSAAATAPSLGLQPWQLMIALLPHAFIELTAVFLPLAAFLYRAKTGKLIHLGYEAWVSALVALPLLLIAATIEILVAPVIIQAMQ